jgi:hypothetical protein
MEWLGSDHVGVPKDKHAKTEELFSVHGPCGEDIRIRVVELERIVEREKEWDESSAAKEEEFD